MFRIFKRLKRHDDDDLANIILFGHPQRSLQQSTTQHEDPASVTQVDRQNLQPDRQNAAPKETYNERKNKVEPVQQQKITLEDYIINDFLQRIFFITVNFDKNNNRASNYGGVPYRCIKLTQLHQELTDLSQPHLLNFENLQQGLRERLLMDQVKMLLCTQRRNREKAVTLLSDVQEDLLIKYLSSCFIRCKIEEMKLTSIIPKGNRLMDEIKQISIKCRELIISYSRGVVVELELFPALLPSNINNQLLYAMMTSLDVPMLKLYMENLIEKLADFQVNLVRIFSQLLDVIWEKSQKLTLWSRDVLPLLESLTYFTNNVDLTKLLMKSKYWWPYSTQSRTILGTSFEKDTILGKFLSLSSIPKEDEPSADFKNFSQQSESEIENITDYIRQKIDKVVNKLHQILYNLLRGQYFQNEVLQWLGMCLLLNLHKGKGNRTAASDGFLLNLTHVLLKLCEPILEPQSKQLIEVDIYYGTVACIVDSEKRVETTLQLIGRNCSIMMVKKRENRIIRCMKNFEETVVDLKKLSNSLEGIPILFDFVMTNAISKHLAIKAHINSPSLSQLSLKFAVANSYWLIQQVLAGPDYLKKKHRELQYETLLKNEIPPAVTVIPESFVENVGDTVRFFRIFNEGILETGENLQYIIEFFAVLLGNGKLIENPHLRAKLAKSLATILPAQKQLACDTISSRFHVELFEKSQVARDILPRSLLQLFVDAESYQMEIYDRFDYRHSIYAILKYIWEIPSYNETFHKINEEDRVAYREDLVLATFPRFINLLMNDSTFLLNEALQSISEIKELEEEQENNLWDFLSPEEMREKAANLLLSQLKAHSHNTLANRTIEVLTLITKDIKRPFASSFLLDGMASFLNFFYAFLLGPKRKELKATGERNIDAKTDIDLVQLWFAKLRRFLSGVSMDALKKSSKKKETRINKEIFEVLQQASYRIKRSVKDFHKYNFNPKDLLINVTHIYLSLSIEDEFIQAVVKDERSFSTEMFEEAVKTLEKLDSGLLLAEGLQSHFIPRLKLWSEKLVDYEKDMPEPPDEFVDPISCMLMCEPVQLPSSHKTVCKLTIAKHLLSDERDPFNRQPLKLDEVIPCKDLEKRIKDWMMENNVINSTHTGDSGAV